MSGHRYSELILFKLTCLDAKCGQTFQKVIGQLTGGAIPCPRCGKPVDLKAHKRAIDDFVELAAELDKLPRQ